MAKQGMARPERTHTRPRNEMPPVPELQGKAKNSNQSANPIVSGTSGSDQKVIHTERPVSKSDRDMDSDSARDNLENKLPDAGLNDL
ncbi:MAG: hypothetical protein ACI4MF_03810 [Candidatus Faecivicinus sp.]